MCCRFAWITSRGVEAVLGSFGFEPEGLPGGPGNGGLQHVVALLSRRGTYDVQWGIVNPEATPFFWGGPTNWRRWASHRQRHAQLAIPASSGVPIISDLNEGLASADAVQVIVAGLSAHLSRVEARLRAFTTRREVRDYLLVNREPKDRRDFAIPGNLPLQLLTAATLAARSTLISSAPDPVAETEACHRVVSRTRSGSRPASLKRLRVASATLCG